MRDAVRSEIRRLLKPKRNQVEEKKKRERVGGEDGPPTRTEKESWVGDRGAPSGASAAGAGGEDTHSQTLEEG